MNQGFVNISENEAEILRVLRHWLKEGQIERARARLEHLKNETGHSAEWYYRLGNLLYEYQGSEAAGWAWEQSREQPQVSVQISSKHLAKGLPAGWQTAVSVVIIVLSLYALIILSFPRQFDALELFLMGLAQSQNAEQEASERSWWDEFWDTKRPRLPHENYYRSGDIWSVLKNQWQELWGESESQKIAKEANKGLSGMEQRLVEWLRDYRRYGRNLRQFDTADQYQILAKGLWNLREFEPAIELLNQGLEQVTTDQQKGLIYQELATIYYYKGYHLQPDGLARYDLELVRKSAEAYELAQKYLQDGYLYGNLGWAYYLLGDYQQAVEAGERALALDGSLNYVRMNLGITFIRMDDYERAFEAYTSLLKYAPDAWEYEGGTRDLKELVREFPGRYPFVDFIFGYVAYQQGHYKKAQQHLQTFLQQPFSERIWQQKAADLLREMEFHRSLSRP